MVWIIEDSFRLMVGGGGDEGWSLVMFIIGDKKWFPVVKGKDDENELFLVLLIMLTVELTKWLSIDLLVKFWLLLTDDGVITGWSLSRQGSVFHLFVHLDQGGIWWNDLKKYNIDQVLIVL